MMTLRVEDRKESFELVIPHREQHLSRESPCLSIFRPWEVCGWKGLVERHRKRAERERRGGAARPARRPAWKSSGKISVHRDERVRTKQRFLELDKGRKVNAYKAIFSSYPWAEICHRNKLVSSVSSWFSWHTSPTLWMGPDELTYAGDWPMTPRAPPPTQASASTCPPWYFTSHLHFSNFITKEVREMNKAIQKTQTQ